MLLTINHGMWFGPHCASAVGAAAPSSSPAATAQIDLTANARGIATAYATSASLTDGRSGDAVGRASSSGASATGEISARGGAVGKVNELTQGDVTAALQSLPIEGSLTLRDVMRLLLAVVSGDATGLDGNPAFKSADGSKTRLAGTISSGNRTITTRDAT